MDRRREGTARSVADGGGRRKGKPSAHNWVSCQVPGGGLGYYEALLLLRMGNMSCRRRDTIIREAKGVGGCVYAGCRMLQRADIAGTSCQAGLAGSLENGRWGNRHRQLPGPVPMRIIVGFQAGDRAFGVTRGLPWDVRERKRGVCVCVCVQVWSTE